MRSNPLSHRAEDANPKIDALICLGGIFASTHLVLTV